jgi:hypothetical protein
MKKMKEMGKITWAGMAVLCFTLTAALLPLPEEAKAVKELNLLEVSGIFRAFDAAATPNVIVLDVNGQEGSAPLFDGCSFLNEKGEEINGADFVRQYLDRVITLELLEDTGEIFSCRPGA